MNVFDILKERGFIEQTTHEEDIRTLLGKEKVTFYIGYDPTADSLTAGGFLTLMAMGHLQKAGHRPVVLIGGGTGMIGDPTDRTEMRKMMTPEQIEQNAAGLRRQMERFIDFTEGKAVMVNNADWLMSLSYVSFLRDYGIHFSVNRMLTADAYRTRFERGLTFFELNYMVMQAYDFLELSRRQNCFMQFGGSDQWGNIIAGMELIRRTDGKNAYGMTFRLLSRFDGEKMGKSAEGAIWLDPEKTSPYDFYQYFRNTDDRDTENFLKLLTYMPLPEISALMSGNINDAKKALAYETTKLVHGEAAANAARDAAAALFGGGGDDSAMPVTEIPSSAVTSGINIVELLEISNLIPSRSEARRLITQGGVSVSGEKISGTGHTITITDFTNGELIIKKGKKTFHKIRLV